MSSAETRQLALDTAHRIARGELFEDDLLVGIGRLFGLEARAALGRYSLAGDGGCDAIRVEGGLQLPPEEVELRRRSAHCHPGWSTVGQRGAPQVVRLSDLVSPRQFWDTEAYAVFHRPERGRYPANAMLVANRRELVFLALQRRTRDFTEKDVGRLGVVQRALAAAFAFREALDRAVAEAEDELFPTCSGLSSAAPSVHLGIDYVPTQREAEVLALVAEGWTNHRIAGQLGLSERTVRKHLSSVYEKSMTYSRAAAAAWWQRRQPW